MNGILAFLVKWLGNFKTYTAVGLGIGVSTEKFLAGEISPEEYATVLGVGAVFAALRATLGKVLKYVKAIFSALELIKANPQAAQAMQKALKNG